MYSCLLFGGVDGGCTGVGGFYTPPQSAFSDDVIARSYQTPDISNTSCQFLKLLHCVSKNVPPLTCYNGYIHGFIATIFGENVAEKVGNQNALYFPTSLN